MTKTKKLLTTALLASTAAGAGAVTAQPAAAAQSDNPYTMQGLCGSQYGVVARAPIGSPDRTRYLGEVVVGRRADGGRCAVMLKYARVGEPTQTKIRIATRSAVTVAEDGGLYTYYAGPVKTSARGCLTFSGDITMPSYSTFGVVEVC